MRGYLLAAILLAITTPVFAEPADAEKTAEPTISFTKDIAPIFVESCVACHNKKTTKGKYDMSTFDAIFKGNDEPVVVAGEPFESRLVLMMYGDDEPTMPKDADLLDESVVAKVELWVKQGAKFDGPDKSLTLRQIAPGRASQPIPTNYTTPTPITAMAFNPDGTVLAAAGYHEITFWNADDGTLIHRLPTKSERIHDLQFSPDGAQLVHAGGIPGRFGEVVVWDAKTYKPVKSLIEIEDLVYAASFSPDGKQVAGGGTDRIFRIWDLASGKALHEIENHADWIIDLAFSADGKRIFTASRDKSAKIWDQSTAEPILTFPSHSDGVYGIAVSPDGKTAYSVGADKTWRTWTASGEGKQVRSVNAHGDVVYALASAPSGKVLFTAGADNLVKAWNPADGKAIRDFKGHEDWVYSLAVSKDEKKLASGSWDGAIRIWDVESGKELVAFVAVPTLALAKADQQKEKPAEKPKAEKSK